MKKRTVRLHAITCLSSFFIFLSILLPQSVFAASGLLVSLTMDESSSGAVQVVLTSELDKTINVSLVDNGEKPDVTAGDGQYSGADMVGPGIYSVQLSVDSGTYDGESFEIPDDSQPRDLYLSLSNGSLSSKLGVAGGGAQEATRNRAEAMGSGGVPMASVAPNGAPAMSPEAATNDALAPKGAVKKTKKSKKNLFYPLIAVVAITLAGTAFILLKPDGEGKVDNRLSLLPQPGLLGEGTPAIDDGFIQWLVADKSKSLLLQKIMKAMTHYDRTLLVSSKSIDVQVDLGSKIYHLQETDPFVIADIIESLSPKKGTLAICFIDVISSDSSLEEYLEGIPSSAYIHSISTEIHSDEYTSVMCELHNDTWSFTVIEKKTKDSPDESTNDENSDVATTDNNNGDDQSSDNNQSSEGT